MAIHVITDSTAYLPKPFVEQEQIRVVPLNVFIQEKQYREGVDISNQQCYHLMRTQPVFPHTSQPSAGDFLQAYTFMESGDQALVMLISSHLSGTRQSAIMARDLLARSDISIHILESRSTSVGLSLMVIRACELRARGFGMDAILAEMDRIIARSNLYFVVDDLEYLARGGRIGHAAKAIGNILQVKPVLYLKEGRIEVFDKIRTKHKAIDRIVKVFASQAAQLEKAAVTHIDAPQEALDLRNRLAEFYPHPMDIIESGPVIGAHVGPGTVGLAYY